MRRNHRSANTLYWDNIQTKQIVRVIYYSEDFFDIRRLKIDS